MTTLPPLPVENEDPWWTKRNNFDLAVKAILEGRLSEEEMDNLYSNFISSTIVTNRGDLLVATGNADLDRLALGAAGQILVSNPASPSGVQWSDELGKFIPLSTVVARGDIIAGTGIPGAGAVTRLPLGTDAYVLVADSTQPAGLAWSNQLATAMSTAQDAMNLATETAISAITSVVVEYSVSASDTIPPTTGWSTDMPARTPGTYIWSRTITTYGDESTVTSSPVLLTGNSGTQGPPGTPGVGVSSTAVTYQVHTSGTTAPTGTWQSSPQATTTGQFLWTRTITTMTDASTTTAYSVAAHGSTGATGVAGVGVSSTAVTYQVHSNGTTAPVGAWLSTPQATTTGQFLWTRTVTTYTDASTSTGYSVSAHGATGTAGSAGRGISSTAVTYQVGSSGTVVPVGTWLSSPAATAPGEFLWSRTIITYTDASSSTAYSVSAHGATGAAGTPGAAGRGISSTAVTYQVHTNGTVAPTGTWVAGPPATTAGTFLWTRTITTYTDTSTVTAYSVSAHGTTGTGVSSTAVTYQVHSNGTTAPVGAWQSTPQATTPGTFLWTRTITTYTDTTTSTSYSVSAHGTTGATGTPGVGISSTAVTYQVHNSGTVAPTGTWVASPPATTPGTFLWTRTITTLTDTSTATAYSVSAHGTTGVGVTSSAVTYQVHTSGTVTPTGTWLTFPAATSPGQFLWSRTITTYSDTSTSTVYSVSAHGATGSPGTNGIGISSTAVTYQVHSNGTVAPVGTWYATPQATTPGQFLWTRTVTTFTDASSVTSYSVAAHGTTGTPGVGISATAVTYQVHTNGTTAPTGTWVATPQATTTGQFLWTRTITTYTDTTSTTAYSVSAHGATGGTGGTGTPGRGISSTAVTYQVHTDGTVAPVGTWQTSPQLTTPGTFLWTRTVTTYTDTTTSTSYSVAAHGTTGTAGRGISSTAVTYQIHSNGTTAPTGTWTASPTATVPGQYLWTRTIITYTDLATSTAYSVSAHGSTGVGISSTVVTYQVHTSATVTPTGTWLSSPAATSPGQFLWTRTITTMTDTSSVTSYSVSAHGATGSTGGTGPAGNGISSTVVTYQLHSNGTTAPVGTWVSTPPATSTGQFLWTRIVITYTDLSSATAYSVSAHGATGGAGTPGVDATNVIVGNDAAAIPTDSSGTTASTFALTIPFGGWVGNARAAATVVASGLPAGITAGTNTPATGSADGSLILNVASASTLGGTSFGEITLTFTCNSKVFVNKFSWTKAPAGASGGSGTPGVSATTIDVGNDAVVIPCTSAGVTVAGSTITIPFTGFVGATRAAITVAVTGLPTGITVQTNTAGTSGAAGSLILAVANASTLGGTDRGDITLTFTCNSLTFVQLFSWSKGIAGATGGAGTPGKSVSSVTSYYQLVTQGAAAPAAPTLNPPGGGWTLTEPAYVGNTELYRCELCVFSDATFSWSTVTKVSAYTASTQAINAANVAAAAAAGMITASTVAPAHGVGKLWFQLDGSGNTIGIKISNGTVWASYTLVADQILVPGTVGTVQIKDNAITAGKIFASEVWADAAWLDTLRVADAIEVNMVNSSFSSDLTLESNVAFQAVITTQGTMGQDLDAVENDINSTNTSLGNLTTKVGEVDGVAQGADTKATDAGTLAATNNAAIAKTQTWFRVDDTGAHIGKSDTAFVTHIYPGKMTINDGLTELSSWEGGMMTVPVLKATSKITIGRHEFVPFPDPNPTGTVIRSVG